MTTPPHNVPKNFFIKCLKCCYARVTTGISSDLQDLHEIVNCTHCGGVRRFRCPRCGNIMKMRRIKADG